MITNEQKLALEARIKGLEAQLAEATKPQGPVHWRAVLCAEQVPQHPTPTAHVVGFRKFSDAESWVAAKLDFDGWRYTLEPLFATPQPCPNCAEGMVSVTKEDANNYCRILTLLGMEEEGSPVEGVERLIFLRDGMTCGDCNDTGWLENREEGRYPCTCMTEAEPYQLLLAERDALTSALAAKTADFDRLCKDFDEHDAELKRIIAGLRAELAQAKIYMPARSAEAMPKTENGPCNFEYWRLVKVAE